MLNQTAAPTNSVSLSHMSTFDFTKYRSDQRPSDWVNAQGTYMDFQVSVMTWFTMTADT